jgi:hypothetical protein
MRGEMMITSESQPENTKDLSLMPPKSRGGTGSLSPRRNWLRWIATMVTIAAATSCMLFGWCQLDANRSRGSTTQLDDPSNFAPTLEQIQEAKCITWTATIYERYTGKDGQRQWYKTTRKKSAYKAPGLYRSTILDDQGNVESIEITDAVKGRKLTLFPSTRTAVFFETPPSEETGGPFADARRMFQSGNLQFVEKQETVSGEFNLFTNRASKTCFACWIDDQSKQLVEYRINCGDKDLSEYQYDRSNALSEKEFSSSALVGSITAAIEYDANLDDSLFQLNVPKDYSEK